MSDKLLEEYVRETLSELHIDKTMKAIIGGRVGQSLLQQFAKAKGLATRWGLERGIDITPAMEKFAARAFSAYTKRYGNQVAPAALVQILDRKYNNKHVGTKFSVADASGGREAGGPERIDDQKDARLV